MHFEFFLQEQRLIVLLIHLIPHCNILKFPSVNLRRTAISRIIVFMIYFKTLQHRQCGVLVYVDVCVCVVRGGLLTS